jgi:phosphoenolpyruvate carboxykinase (ATP)
MLKSLIGRKSSNLMSSVKFMHTSFLSSTNAVVKPQKLLYNLSPSQLYEHALTHESATNSIASSGALVASSGIKTGRSPKDKRIVRNISSEHNIWWANTPMSNSPNYESSEMEFIGHRTKAIKHINSLERVYVVDGYANWDPNSRTKVRVITQNAYHALFMHNMLIRDDQATAQQRQDEPDFTIYNAGAEKADTASGTCVSINLERKEMVILGTQYAGEMKKGVFSFIHYIMPLKGILSLHSGCNIGLDGDVTLFFGLSGTGKTTLSTDPNRPLIGDDEHCWGDDGVFNIEHGCYAKCLGLSPIKEPEIFNAIKFGTVLENVVMDATTRVVDFSSSRITENTRASYPIEAIANARIPCVGSHPKNIIMLCCDAYGVLPPVSKLTTEQAMYHFINGYTSKMAGTEVGVTEPQTTFSACYGGAFLMWHPMKYASMLAEKVVQHDTTVWLVNTGWTGGTAARGGKRIDLKYTRAIVNAIHDGSMTTFHPPSRIFNLQVPTECPGVPTDILQPQHTWDDAKEYDITLNKLAQRFNESFEKYVCDAQQDSKSLIDMIQRGGPTMQHS